jgi:branched-chain amino acid aminotransferase
VARSPWPRNERAPTAGAKTTAYADNIVVARWAVAQGAGEALMANLAGNLCEATAANVFVEVDGVLVTPTLASGCLGGVTRGLLLELGVAEERDVPFDVLDHTSEAFLSSTTRHVHPIASIDGLALATCPGPLTQAAADAFEHLLATTPDP